MNPFTRAIFENLFPRYTDRSLVTRDCDEYQTGDEDCHRSKNRIGVKQARPAKHPVVCAVAEYHDRNTPASAIQQPGEDDRKRNLHYSKRDEWSSDWDVLGMTNNGACQTTHMAATARLTWKAV